MALFSKRSFTILLTPVTIKDHPYNIYTSFSEIPYMRSSLIFSTIDYRLLLKKDDLSVPVITYTAYILPGPNQKLLILSQS